MIYFSHDYDYKLRSLFHQLSDHSIEHVKPTPRSEVAITVCRRFALGTARTITPSKGDRSDAKTEAAWSGDVTTIWKYDVSKSMTMEL